MVLYIYEGGQSSWTEKALDLDAEEQETREGFVIAMRNIVMVKVLYIYIVAILLDKSPISDFL